MGLSNTFFPNHIEEFSLNFFFFIRQEILFKIHSNEKLNETNSIINNIENIFILNSILFIYFLWSGFFFMFIHHIPTQVTELSIDSN